MAEEKACNHNYTGIDRRKLSDRRSDECKYHEAHVERFINLEKKNARNCHAVELLQRLLESKVSMKLFYTIVFLIIATLGVQWGTYQVVNNMALTHIKEMGDINTKMAEMSAEIKHGNDMSRAARSTIKDALEKSDRVTTTKIDKIQRTIENFNGQP